MPRQYVRKPGSRTYRNYSTDKLEEAMLEIIEGRLSILQASKEYNIPFGTLHNKLKGKHFGLVGAPTLLSKVEEDRIVQCLQICGDWGYPLDTDDIRITVQYYLKSIGM